MQGAETPPVAREFLAVRHVLRRLHPTALRAFPVIYARDVKQVAHFYLGLGFIEQTWMPGAAGFVSLRRNDAELAVIEPGPGPRHELFALVATAVPS